MGTYCSRRIRSTVSRDLSPVSRDLSPVSRDLSRFSSRLTFLNHAMSAYPPLFTREGESSTCLAFSSSQNGELQNINGVINITKIVLNCMTLVHVVAIPFDSWRCRESEDNSMDRIEYRVNLNYNRSCMTHF